MPDKIVKVIKKGKLDYFKKTQDYLAHSADIWEKDAVYKLDARKKYAPFFIFCLVVQNVFTYWFLLRVYKENIIYLIQLQPLFTSFLLGMIIETAYIVKQIIKWIFSDIDYSKHPINNKNGAGEKK